MSLCALIFLLPVPLGSYRPWAIFAIGCYICFVFILHCISCLIPNSTHNYKLYPPRYSWPLLSILMAVIFILCIQLIPHTGVASIDPYQTTSMALKTVFLLLFSWLVFCRCNTIKRIRLVIFTLIGSGVCQAIYATYLNFSPNINSLVFNSPYTQRAVGSFTYPNFLANYLAMCLALGIGVLISELKIKNRQKTPIQLLRDLSRIMLSNKVALRLALIIMIVGLILTRSRMGNSAFFIALALVSFFSIFFYRQKPHYLRVLIISFFVLDFIIVGALFGVEKVKDRLVETSLASETRDEVVRDSVTLILAKPWLGSGGGSFYTAFMPYQTQPYSGYYDNAHNDYIQFSVELGIPMTLALGAFILFSLINCAYVMIKRKTGFYQGVAFGCAVAIIHMLLHSAVDYSLQAGANSFVFILILTISYLAKHLPFEKSYKKQSA